MEAIFEIIGELFTTAAITKELKYFWLGLIGIIGVSCFFYFTSK